MKSFSQTQSVKSNDLSDAKSDEAAARPSARIVPLSSLQRVSFELVFNELQRELDSLQMCVLFNIQFCAEISLNDSGQRYTSFAHSKADDDVALHVSGG